MIRNIIEIDRERCNGCGACAEACHEGAIAMIDGKAALVRDDYCDGLGACLPNCPVGALSVVRREAAPFDEAAVAERMARPAAPSAAPPHTCPGAAVRSLTDKRPDPSSAAPQNHPARPLPGELRQWPVQLQLVPVQAPFFDGAKLLIAADCCAYACASFHRDFMAGHTTVIGCPKLDSAQYQEKLTEILARNDIRSVTLVRMEVPCCGGLEQALRLALRDCGKIIPWRAVTLSLQGEILLSL